MRISTTLMILPLVAIGLGAPGALAQPAPPAQAGSSAAGQPGQPQAQAPAQATPDPTAPVTEPQGGAATDETPAPPGEAAQKGSAQAQTATPVKRTAMVHLTKDTGDLHAVMMALKLARALAQRGAEVTVYLDLEAVRLVDKRAPGDLYWGAGDETLDDILDGFSQAGGSILVCAHCADAVGLTATNVRNGAKIVTPGQLADAMLASDFVLDY